jgi:hypothetical protein
MQILGRMSVGPAVWLGACVGAAASPHAHAISGLNLRISIAKVTLAFFEVNLGNLK